MLCPDNMDDDSCDDHQQRKKEKKIMIGQSEQIKKYHQYHAGIHNLQTGNTMEYRNNQFDEISYFLHFARKNTNNIGARVQNIC